MIVRVLAWPMLFIVSTIAAAPCEAASLLDRLGGEWSGKGTSRNIGSAETEPVACRLGVRVPDNAERADAEGRCGTASGTVRFSIGIVRGDGAQLTAAITTSAAPVRTDYSGRESGQSFTFISRAPVDIKGEYYDSSITIRFRGNNRFGMSHTVAPTGSGDKQTVFFVEFSRKGGVGNDSP